jgi:hypothetical protein
MHSPLTLKYAELYQGLLKGAVGFKQLSNRFIALAERAHILHEFDRLQEIGQVLSNTPVRQYQAVGHYFLAVAANSKGSGDQEQASRLFHLAADTCPDRYKVKALLSLAAVSINAADLQSGFYYYKETISAGGLSIASLEALRGIAVLKAIEGYHGHAIKDLEKLQPIIQFAPPHVYMDYLNSYAVELAELGRLEEAGNAALIAASSPLAAYNPEWQETFSEVSQKLYKSRSSVTIPAPKQQPEVEEPQRRDNVIAFPRREAPAGDILDTLNKPDTISLNPLQLLGVLLKIVLKDNITDEQIERICDVYYELIREYYAE